MKELTVIARVKAKAGKEKELEQAWSKAAELSRKEAGCIGYVLHRSLTDPTLFVSVERWVSAEANDQHMGSAHIQELLRQVPPLVAASPEILPFEVLV
jgi:quinol monooxygenase YgiN